MLLLCKQHKLRTLCKWLQTELMEEAIANADEIG